MIECTLLMLMMLMMPMMLMMCQCSSKLVNRFSQAHDKQYVYPTVCVTPGVLCTVISSLLCAWLKTNAFTIVAKSQSRLYRD